VAAKGIEFQRESFSVRPRDPSRRMLFYGWWYVCLGVGFSLLAVRGMLFGSTPLLTFLRWTIAAGFLILGLVTLISIHRLKGR